MSDDEDVIFKDGPFAEYIQATELNKNNSLFEYEIISKPKENKLSSNCYKIIHIFKNISSNILSYFSNHYYKENTFLNNQLEILLNSGLLLDEDREFLLNLKEDKNLIKNGSIYDLSNYLFTFIITLPFMYSSKVTYILSLTSCMILIRQTLFRTQKESERRKLKDLTKNFIQLFSFFKKSLNLIQENEIIMKGYTLVTSGSIANRIEKSSIISRKQMMPAFRTSFGSNISKIILLTSQGTISLLNNFPLSNNIDKIDHYMCNLNLEETLNLEEFIKIQDLKKFYNISLLIVSEFFKRLALCYFTDFWNNENEIGDYFSKIYKNINLINNEIIKLIKDISIQYKIYYCFGMAINQDKNVKNTQVDTKMKNSEIFISIHSAKMHLQKLLFSLVEIEEDILNHMDDISELYLEKIDEFYEEITSHITSCQDSLNYGISSLNKLKNKNENRENETVDVKSVLNEEDKGEVPKTNPILEEELEDQVFEDVCDKQMELTEDDFEFIDEKNKKSTQKQYSSSLLNELKTVLVTKAKEHIEREEKAYNRRYPIKMEQIDISDSVKKRLNINEERFEENKETPKRKMKTWDEEFTEAENSEISQPQRFGLPQISPFLLNNKIGDDIEYFSDDDDSGEN